MEKATLLHTLMQRALIRSNSKKTVSCFVAAQEAVSDYFDAIEKLVSKFEDTPGDRVRRAA